MKNMEVLHTLRLYDPDFIAKLGLLMEQEQKRYRNRNEFLTALLKRGYDGYIKGDPNENLKEVYPLLKELSEYLEMQFKAMTLYMELSQKLLSSNHRMLLSLAGGEKVVPKKVEDGFFDDLPARFEKIIVNLKTQFGIG